MPTDTRKAVISLELEGKYNTMRVQFPENMTPAEALQASIDKWQFIVDQCRADVQFFVPGIETCGLCELYIDQQNACEGCPVDKEVGKPLCEGTPFDEWCRHADWKPKSRVPHAKAELEFLKSLQAKAEEGE